MNQSPGHTVLLFLTLILCIQNMILEGWHLWCPQLHEVAAHMFRRLCNLFFRASSCQPKVTKAFTEVAGEVCKVQLACIDFCTELHREPAFKSPEEFRSSLVAFKFSSWLLVPTFVMRTPLQSFKMVLWSFKVWSFTPMILILEHFKQIQ